MCRLFACQIVQMDFSWLDQSQCRWALKRQMIEQVKQTLWRAAAVARPPMPAPTTKTGSLPFWFELPPSHQMVVWNVCCFRPSPLGAPWSQMTREQQQHQENHSTSAHGAPCFAALPGASITTVPQDTLVAARCALYGLRWLKIILFIPGAEHQHDSGMSMGRFSNSRGSPNLVRRGFAILSLLPHSQEPATIDLSFCLVFVPCLCVCVPPLTDR